MTLRKRILNYLQVAKVAPPVMRISLVNQSLYAWCKRFPSSETIEGAEEMLRRGWERRHGESKAWEYMQQRSKIKVSCSRDDLGKGYEDVEILYAVITGIPEKEVMEALAELWDNPSAYW